LKHNLRIDQHNGNACVRYFLRRGAGTTTTSYERKRQFYNVCVAMRRRSLIVA